MTENYLTQSKYILFISNTLDKFKRVGNDLYNFRCPYCGDSEKKATKARGYIYKNKEGLYQFQCHNCGENHMFKNFLKFVDNRLFKEYIVESMRGSSNEYIPMHTEENQISKVQEKSWKKELVHVDTLSKIHPVNVYLQLRLIEGDKRKNFYYAQDFKRFTDSLNVLDVDARHEARLVLVETDKDNNLKLIVARALDENSSMRYMTIKVDPEYPKVFGLSRIDKTKTVFVVEGAIDSLFIDNCIATLDSNLMAYENYDLCFDDVVHIWDNEPRNQQIVNNIQKAINKKHKVVIFPKSVKEKDINDMVKAGVNIKQILKEHVKQGISSIMSFNEWKKVSYEQKTKYSARKLFR